jgi:iron complex outermembrane receptor protein
LLTEAARADVLWLHRFGDSPTEGPLTNAQWNRRIVEPGYNIGLVDWPWDSETLRLVAARGVQLPSHIGFGAAVHRPAAIRIRRADDQSEGGLQ